MKACRKVSDWFWRQVSYLADDQLNQNLVAAIACVICLVYLIFIAFR